MKNFLNVLCVCWVAYCLFAAFYPGIVPLPPGPTPDPNPPGPGPEPDPDNPPPFESDKLRVLIVEDSLERLDLPAEQLVIFTAGMTWLAEQNVEYEVLDHETPDVEGVWADALEAWETTTADEEDNEPWVLIANPEEGTSEELPDTLDEFKALVEPYKSW